MNKYCITIRSKEHLWSAPCVWVDAALGGAEVAALAAAGWLEAGQASGRAQSAIVKIVSPASRQEMLEAR